MFAKTKVIGKVAYVIIGDDEHHVEVYEGESLLFSDITLEDALRRVGRIELRYMYSNSVR